MMASMIHYQVAEGSNQSACRDRVSLVWRRSDLMHGGSCCGARVELGEVFPEH